MSIDLLFYNNFLIMATLSLIDLVKKHGAIGVLCAWLVYTNMRLNDVESKLYSCLSVKDKHEVKSAENQKPVAILPKKLKING